MIDVSTIEKHMEVVGSDGQHVGTVDCIGIKTTKSDSIAKDQHHFLKAEENRIGERRKGSVAHTSRSGYC